MNWLFFNCFLLSIPSPSPSICLSLWFYDSSVLGRYQFFLSFSPHSTHHLSIFLFVLMSASGTCVFLCQENALGDSRVVFLALRNPNYSAALGRGTFVDPLGVGEVD